MSMDHQEVMLLVLLDLSGAFDTINHEILLYVYLWFVSYLSNRKQHVHINNGISDYLILYVSWLYQVMASHLPSAHGYADDTQLYLSFKVNDSLSQDHSLMAVEACISDVCAWLIQNCLLINASKTEFLILGSHHQLSKISIDSITVGDSTSQPLGSRKCSQFGLLV